MDNNSSNKKPSSKNLVLLGLFSVFIAIVFASISIYLYHESGDIYLDCSLPGADCPNAHNNKNTTSRENSYTLPNFDKLDDKILDDYLKNLKKTTRKLTDANNSFNTEQLSDESLGF